MSLIRYTNELSPWNALREIETHLNRVFNEENGAPATAHEQWTPPVDVSETEAAYVVEADLPGLTKDDLAIEVFENQLLIRGERKSEHEQGEKNKGYHRMERRYGGFQRTVRIPGGFNADAVEAKFEHGVLRVTLPKTDEARPRKIDVTTN